jgi:hypothetical protein
VPGLVIFLAVMSRGDAVRVRGKIMKLGGSAMPVVSAHSSVIASIASVTHEMLLYEIKQNNTMPISPSLYPRFHCADLPGAKLAWGRNARAEMLHRKAK